MLFVRTLCVAAALLSLVFAHSVSANTIDAELRSLIEKHNLNKPFESDTVNSSEMLAELGSQLFFSPDLSIDGSVACASCHHPSKAGTDGIALPIGIGGEDSRNVGQERIDAAQKANPELRLQGLIPRNSPSVFNAVLYRKAMFWDGRVHYQEDPNSSTHKKIVAGFGAAQHNPSNYLQENLLQTQARMPLTSSFEMKGGQRPNRNSHEIEQDILSFLQSQKFWCVSFAKVFGVMSCDQLITLNHLTQALAAFQATLVFTDSPFQRYIDGDQQALSNEQKMGAIAFLTDKDEGGVGCVNCHSGKSFSSERFYNINIPPSGEGANGNGYDLGRHNVDKTAERFSFRVPILLNIAQTAPYFHNGTAHTLEDAIRIKQTSPKSKKPAKQILLEGIDYQAVSADIKTSFEKGTAKKLLPETLSDTQVKQLASFLRSLSDNCVTDKNCLTSHNRKVIESPRGEQKLKRQETSTLRKAKQAKPPQLSCKHLAQNTHNDSNHSGFSRHNLDIGLNHKRSIGLIKKGWLIDVVNYASVSAVDLNYNCLDDLVFDAGESGILLYQQQTDGHFQLSEVPYSPQQGAVNALTMDLDGDYRFDMFIGNYGQGSAAFVFDFQQPSLDIANLTALSGPIINASIGDINNDGYPDAVFGMWRSFSSFKQPHIWYNDGQGNLSAEQGFIQLRQHEKHVAGDANIKRKSPIDIGVSDLTFTPNLVDINNNLQQDLLLASDFFRSQVLLNSKGRFTDITDKTVIDETNGMGAAVGDFDGNGTMDWFITSIVDKTAPGLTRGHRLYMNQGDGTYQKAPVPNKDVEWSWGACTADFNNDGYLDIFYISGYGEPLLSARYESGPQRDASNQFLKQLRKYTHSRPTLLINNGNGSFSDQSKDFGLNEPLDGRGIACFDYQQDGDIDVVVAPLEGMPVLLRNNLNNLHNSQQTKKNWLALRFIGLPGNTEALGTQVTLHSPDHKQYRQVIFANNFVSRNPTQLHFGLGESTEISKIEIRLPPPHNLNVQLNNLKANQLHVLRISELLKTE